MMEKPVITLENPDTAQVCTGADGISDKSLVMAAQNGDQIAFKQLMHRNIKSAFATAYAILGNTTDAEDAVQEAMIKIFQHLHTLKDEEKVSSWIRNIVKQQACLFLRKDSRFLRFINSMRQEHAIRTRLQTNTRKEKIYHSEVVEYGLRKLPVKSKEVLLLFYIDGLSYEEIAERLNIKLGTVKSHLFKAKAKMQKNLDDVGIHSLEEPE